MMIKKNLLPGFVYFGSFLISIFFLTSCATPVKPLVVTPSIPVVQPRITVMPRQDVFHVVAPGETLWRIGKMYNVLPQDILRANKLGSRNVMLRKGERLLIPDAATLKPVISLYPSRKWKYIIIHHSATDEGDSLSFDRFHHDKGWDGVGYHFIIDNGSKGRVDGQIEVSPRWLKQQDGSHCKADSMNGKAIGICLVGNLNEDSPSLKQMEALAYLVNKLSHYYNIPVGRIMGHGQVRGARTDCPGKRFSWDKFKAELKEQRPD